MARATELEMSREPLWRLGLASGEYDCADVDGQNQKPEPCVGEPGCCPFTRRAIGEEESLA